MTTYSISGKFGDVVCALAIIRELGGGRLLLYPSPQTDNYMTVERAAVLLPLVRSQPYILEADYVQSCEGVDFDRWREHVQYDRTTTILDAMSDAFLDRRLDHETTWLSVTPLRRAELLVSNTWRISSGYDYATVLGPQSAFIGLLGEHRHFEHQVGPIRFLPTPNLLECARLIAGSDRLVCNQSVAVTIALGLGKPYLCELYPTGVSCRWQRRNASYFEGTTPWAPGI